MGSVPKIAEQVVGALLMAMVLLDVFLTVLYARIRTGIISTRLSRGTWIAFRAIASRVRNGAGLLSFCGPVLLVLLVLVWALGLTLGCALILHPHLGTSIKASSGVTDTDFASALFAGGSSLAVVGASNYEPQTTAFKMFYLFTSLVGISVLSLTLTYLMQIYNALQKRNSIALSVDIGTGRTGDAAEFLSGLGPQGHFETGYNTVSDLASSIAAMKEAHHFYPVLFYFRFEEPYYSVSRMANVVLDIVTLIRTALDVNRYRWLAESGAVEDMWTASLLLLTTLEDAFVSGDLPGRDSPSEKAREQERARFFNAVSRLGRAGIAITENPDRAADEYVRLRSEWSPHIRNLAPSMLYSQDEVDPACKKARDMEPNPKAA